MPSSKRQLQQKVEKRVKPEKQKKRAKQAKHYNKGSKDLAELKKGTTVRVQPLKEKKSQWEKAQVENKVNIRSYKIRTEDGRTYRRNRKHLRATKEPFITQEELMMDQAENLIRPSTNHEAQQASSDCNIQQQTPDTRRSSRNRRIRRDKDFIYILLNLSFVKLRT